MFMHRMIGVVHSVSVCPDGVVALGPKNGIDCGCLDVGEVVVLMLVCGVVSKTE